MAQSNFDFREVESFARLFPAGAVPPFPQSIEDLNALPETTRARVQKSLPQLWERLHGGCEARLPADVLVRLNRGELIGSDVTALRAAGLEMQALQLEAQMRESAVQQWEQNYQARRAQVAEQQKINFAADHIGRKASEEHMIRRQAQLRAQGLV